MGLLTKLFGTADIEEDAVKEEAPIKEEPVAEESPYDKYSRRVAEEEAKINERIDKNNAIRELKDSLRGKIRVLKNARNWDKYLSKKRGMLGMAIKKPTPVSYYQPIGPSPRFRSSGLPNLRRLDTPSMHEYNVYKARLEWENPWLAVLCDYNKAMKEGYDFTDSGIEAVREERDAHSEIGGSWVMPEDFTLENLLK